MEPKLDSTVINKEPCPKCREKGKDKTGDNLAVYSDGHKYCFSCHYFDNGTGKVIQIMNTPATKAVELTGTVDALKDRKVSHETAQKYNVHTEYHPYSDRPKTRIYPYYDQKLNVTGAKVRSVDTKSFKTTGNMRDNTLFGQQLFRNKGKYVTVVEGEEDALAAYELLGRKWPVVSVSKGAAGARKDFMHNLEWLEGFDNVIICFDNDDPGIKAAYECADVLSPNKGKVVSLSEYKDASDYLVRGKVSSFTAEWWEAKPYRPTGIVSFGSESMWESFVTRKTVGVIPLPASYGSLNAMLNGGIAMGEVTIIGALTSIGKTTMVYNLLYDMALESGRKIGGIFLESDKGETTEKLCSLHMGKNLSIDNDVDFSVVRNSYDDLKGKASIEVFDHQGSSDIDDLFSKMRYMIKGLECEVLILDPLQAAVPSNENASIDKFMDSVLKLAKETSASIIVVSHMNKPATNDPHAITEYNTKGSGSINQIAFNTILLSRDKMSEDPYERNLTQVRLVKCRRTGRTGLAGWMFYDETTTKMLPGSPPEEHRANEEEEF